MARVKRTYPDLPSLREFIAELPPERKDVAEKLLKEIVFLEGTLVKLKEQIEAEGATIETDTGSRENPALKAYNTSIQRYSLLFKQVTDLFPKMEAKAATDPLIDFIKDGAK